MANYLYIGLAAGGLKRARPCTQIAATSAYLPLTLPKDQLAGFRLSSCLQWRYPSGLP